MTIIRVREINIVYPDRAYVSCDGAPKTWKAVLSRWRVNKAWVRGVLITDWMRRHGMAWR